MRSISEGSFPNEKSIGTIIHIIEYGCFVILATWYKSWGRMGTQMENWSKSIVIFNYTIRRSSVYKIVVIKLCDKKLILLEFSGMYLSDLALLYVCHLAS